MLQRVRERRDETGIVRWHLGEICRLLRHRSRRWIARPRAAVGLNPFAASTVHRTRPQRDRSLSERGIRELQNDAADVRAGEEIGASELEIVQRALRVEEEWLARAILRTSGSHPPLSRVPQIRSRRVPHRERSVRCHWYSLPARLQYGALSQTDHSLWTRSRTR